MPRVSVSRDDGAVILAFGPEKGPGHRATLQITHRGLVALVANLSACADSKDPDFEAECILTGELTTGAVRA